MILRLKFRTFREIGQWNELMAKKKCKLTACERAEKKRRRQEFMTIFMHGKMKRIRRPPQIDGVEVTNS
jgi:uncharacterized protein YnzC (UPF0291/DUF896 family)